MRVRVLPALLLLLGCAEPPVQPPPAFPPAPGHWPHARGPNLDGVSTETGLLREWPAGGPRLLWKTKELGDGIPPVSVAGGLIFALGYKQGQEFLSALDGEGSIVWMQPVGPSTGEVRIMRFLNQRAVTVDDDRVYAFIASGVLVCLSSHDGEVLWKVDYVGDLQGRRTSFGWTDTPVVEGELLLCIPGGSKGAVAALNKRTGRTVWRCGALQEQAENAGLAVAQIAGVRQAIHLAMKRVSGIDVATGRLLWSKEIPGRTAMDDPPIVHGDRVFVALPYRVGCFDLEVSRKGDAFSVREAYTSPTLSALRGNFIRVGDHVYAEDDRAFKCIDLRDGGEVWSDKTPGLGTLTGADGLLVVKGYKGDVLLVPATSDGFRVTGRLRPAELPQDAHMTFPVIAGGRLYLRYLDELYCYDLRGPDYRGLESPWKIPARPRLAPPDPELGKGTAAAFVATPHDVVARMLREGGVHAGTRLLDLGSGDGRILIAAARDHGAHAMGFEINRELVQLSRGRILEAKLQSLASVVESDLFQADLSVADVITLYLGEANNEKLLPKLRLLKPGTKIVSHIHRLGNPGPAPVRTLRMMSTEDGLEHEIHVWTLPFRE